MEKLRRKTDKICRKEITKWPKKVLFLLVIM